ncbi:MAG: hypothetical protein RBR53_00050 [Desulforegulaceae bacterium]|nr:hypothetical protein [Desulforegulaceae bacterium]
MILFHKNNADTFNDFLYGYKPEIKVKAEKIKSKDKDALRLLSPNLSDLR